MSDDELLAVFSAEVDEQLESLRTGLAGAPAEWDVQLLFRLAHNVKGAARMVGATAVRDAAHTLEELLAALRDGATRTQRRAALVREGATLLARTFAAMQERREAPQIDGYRRAVEEALADENATGEGFAESATDLPSETPARQTALPTSGEEPAGPANADTIRIRLDRLEGLLDLATEFDISTYRGNLERDLADRLAAGVDELQREIPELRRHPLMKRLAGLARDLRRNLGEDAHHGNRLAGQLQGAIRSLRMVRVDSARALLGRVVDDACGTAERQAGFFIQGGDTEIDRVVLDSLRDPLVHLLRNAVAHGIEAAADRVAAGKPADGTIRLTARAAGAWVELAVVDDGRGVDPRAIRARLVEQGMLKRAEADGKEQGELVEYLFHPGFSTARTVNELAGRGVGLDVVRSNVRAIGGDVSVSSTPGGGTTFHLRVPLTRLTTRGIVVRLGARWFVAPVMNMERTLLASRKHLQHVEGQLVLEVDGVPLPATRLESVLDCKSDGDANRPAIVLSEGRRRGAFLVDEVLGEREFLMQPLPWNIKRLRAHAGMTVLDGGVIAPILNISDLLEAPEGRSTVSADEQVSERRRQILVADDSVTSRTLEKNILAAAGYDIRVAVDGEDAWKQISERMPDLVISDVEMPRLDGLGLVKRIRADQRTSRLPVILVTSLGNEEHRAAGAAAGASAYIVKGAFDQDELLRSVARLL